MDYEELTNLSGLDGLAWMWSRQKMWRLLYG